ncbi:uncharacterized protein A1O9_00133 [Exophiala aquamarina CBS 119918]|uniref:Uncharacterized protein n=1 Tax=Exophiala aquamarina CBS 119918 TaxID=1182545 RepID=A0A072PQK4_9EURO|nr:uncharacterized protein A1O9_00133 [Exophiala aquamarina CBS 119918]KEF62161.1 hypothetical protein A1O9_00133 [Exophiala aquamarina CBS 119918]
MLLLLAVFHAGQAIASAYVGTFSAIAIFNLQKREEQTKQAAKYLDTAAHQLHKTRTTQTSGAVATLTSLVSSLILAASLAAGTTSLVLSTANALGLALAYNHLTSFWQNKAKVPFVKDYNDGIRASNNLRQLLAGLTVSWGLATCFYAWQTLSD